MSGDPPLEFRPLLRRNLDSRVCRDTVPQRLDHAQPILNRQGRQFGEGLSYVDHEFILTTDITLKLISGGPSTLRHRWILSAV